MIQWLKEKFEAWVTVLVVLTIAISGIVGGIFGYTMLRGFVGFVIGAVIAFFASLIFCISVYGLIATVVCIANSTDKNTELLTNINSNLETLNKKMSALDSILYKLDSVSAAKNVGVSPSGGGTGSSEISSSETETETFDIITMNGKLFAVKDSAAGAFFCPKCHAQVVETDFYCGNCNARLLAD